MTKTIVIIGLTCVTIACTKHEVAQSKTYVDSKRGWTTKELIEQSVLLLSSPVQEANWQTNVCVVLRPVSCVLRARHKRTQDTGHRTQDAT